MSRHGLISSETATPEVAWSGSRLLSILEIAAKAVKCCLLLRPVVFRASAAAQRPVLVQMWGHSQRSMGMQASAERHICKALVPWASRSFWQRLSWLTGR